MLLAIDIGNTSITFGLLQDKRIIRTFNIPTQEYSLKRLKTKLPKTQFKDAVICSVVPKITKKLGQDLADLSGGKPYIIGKDILVPIKNLYQKPKEVGQDRLVNAFAALELYKAPLIAIDFGTAITFDIISKNREYLGGMILPGLKISLEALNQKTALLPKIKLQKPDSFIGKDTKNSMLSGIFYGFGCLTDGLITSIRKVIGRRALVVATGGNMELISKYCRMINKVDTKLTLKGLGMLYFCKKSS
jgi:type III pantothenate kinase